MSREGAAPGPQFTIAVAIVGAITFVALVLVLQNPTSFEVPQKGLLVSLTGHQEFLDLVIYLSAVCVLSAFSVLASAFVGAGLVRFDSLLGWFGYVLGGVTISGFAVAAWLLVSQEGDLGSDAILGLIVILAVVFFAALLRGLQVTQTKP